MHQWFSIAPPTLSCSQQVELRGKSVIDCGRDEICEEGERRARLLHFDIAVCSIVLGSGGGGGCGGGGFGG